MIAPNSTSSFEAFGHQVWDAWIRQWTGAAAAPAAESSSVPGMDDLKRYLDWMQQAGTSAMGQAGPNLPPMPPFASWGSPGQAAPPLPGLDVLRQWLDTPAFGYGREQQAQQQALMRALLDHQQASAHYQQLVARAQAQGAELLQRRLAEPGFSGASSLKAMYDLWVDAVEEAYAEIALSDEFCEAYAAQANTQMRVRQLQFRQMEQWCREAGLPTRSEVDTLGQRLQELRRELRRMRAVPGANAQSEGRQAAVKTAKRSVTSAKPATRAKAKPATGAGQRAPRKPR